MGKRGRVRHALNGDALRSAMNPIGGDPISMREVGDAMGCHLTNVQKWLQETRGASMGQVWRLCELLNRSVSDLAPTHHAEMLAHGVTRPPAAPTMAIDFIRNECRQAVGVTFRNAMARSGITADEMAVRCGPLAGDTTTISSSMVDRWRNVSKLPTEWWAFARACTIVGVDVGDLGETRKVGMETSEDAVDRGACRPPVSQPVAEDFSMTIGSDMLDMAGIAPQDRLALMTLASSLRARTHA